MLRRGNGGSNNTNGGENLGGNGGGGGDWRNSYFNYSGDPNLLNDEQYVLEMKRVMAEKNYEIMVWAGEVCVDFLKKKVNVAVAEVKGREDVKQYFITLGKLEKKTERFVKQCKEWEGDADFDEHRVIMLKDIEELKEQRKVITDKLAAEDESIRETYNARFAEMMIDLEISGGDMSEVMVMWKNFVYQDHVAKLD